MYVDSSNSIENRIAVCVNSQINGVTFYHLNDSFNAFQFPSGSPYTLPVAVQLEDVYIA